MCGCDCVRVLLARGCRSNSTGELPTSICSCWLCCVCWSLRSLRCSVRLWFTDSVNPLVTLVITCLPADNEIRLCQLHLLALALIANNKPPSLKSSLSTTFSCTAKILSCHLLVKLAGPGRTGHWLHQPHYRAPLPYSGHCLVSFRQSRQPSCAPTRNQLRRMLATVLRSVWC